VEKSAGLHKFGLSAVPVSILAETPSTQINGFEQIDPQPKVLNYVSSNTSHLNQKSACSFESPLREKQGPWQGQASPTIQARYNVLTPSPTERGLIKDAPSEARGGR